MATLSRHSTRWRGHQLDPVAAGGDRQDTWDAPVFAPPFDLEPAFAQSGEGRLEVGGDDRDVGARGNGRRILMHEMDLRPAMFEPGEVLGQRRRRLDLLEAEQLPEPHRALQVRGRDLDSDVVQHAASLRPPHPQLGV
jgi:hypothetical protein